MIILEILQIVGLGVVATVIILVLNVQKPEISLQVSVITGIVIFMLVAGKIAAIVELLKSYAAKADIDGMYLGILLKIIGIAYITEFGAEICRDAGEGSIASKIELAGKTIVAVMAVPIITSVLDLVFNIMP
jgi:stage III sporulation protein AD